MEVAEPRLCHCTPDWATIAKIHLKKKKKSDTIKSHIWFHLYEIFRIDKSIATESSLVFSLEAGQRREWEIIVSGYGVSYFVVMKIFCN